MRALLPLATALGIALAACSDADESDADKTRPDTPAKSRQDAAPDASTQEPAKPRKPTRPPPENRAPLKLTLTPLPRRLSALAPSNAVAAISARSLAAFEREFGWVRVLFDGRPLPELVGAVAGDAKWRIRTRESPDKPVACVFGPAARPTFIIPYSRGYWSTAPRRAGNGKLGRQAVGGTVSARIDVAKFLRSPACPKALGPLLTPIREARCGLGLRRSDGVAVLEAALSGARNGPLDAGPLPSEPRAIVALLRALPRTYPITLAVDFEPDAVKRTLRGLTAYLGRREPPLFVPRHLGRGFALGVGLTDAGLEAVVLIRSPDPDALFAECHEYLRGLVAAGVFTRVDRSPSTRIEGVTVQHLHLSYTTRDLSEPRPNADDGFRALRALGRADGDAATHDAAVLRERFRVTYPESSPGVRPDPAYLFLAGTPEPLGHGLFHDIATQRGVVKLRRVRHPTDADRKRLGAARAEVGAALPVEGGVWVPVAAHADGTKNWQVDGRVLTLNDDEQLTNADIAWSWTSTARRGPDADTRDVSLRWKEEAVARWRTFTDRAGEPAFAVVVDGQVQAISSYVGPATAEADVLGLAPRRAARLAAFMTAPPLRRSYADDGRRSRRFADAGRRDKALARVIGAASVSCAYGVVDTTAFAAFGPSPDVTERVIRALKNRLRPAPAPLETILKEAGGAVSLVAYWDAAATYAAATRLWDTRSPAHVGDIRPAHLLAWHIGPRLRARLSFDPRLGVEAARWREDQRPLRTRAAAARLKTLVGRWREVHESDVPTPRELPEASWNDDWNRAMRVEPVGRDSFLIRSAGPDGRLNTGDDITR